MTEEKNISLEKMNSFGVIHRAKKLISFENKDEVIRYLKNNKSEIDDVLILGEGSNTLFTKDYNGIIFQSNIKGIEIIKAIYKTVRDSAYSTSIQLAKERGSFPVWDWQKEKVQKYS